MVKFALISEHDKFWLLGRISSFCLCCVEQFLLLIQLVFLPKNCDSDNVSTEWRIKQCKFSQSLHCFEQNFLLTEQKHFFFTLDFNTKTTKILIYQNGVPSFNISFSFEAWIQKFDYSDLRDFLEYPWWFSKFTASREAKTSWKKIQEFFLVNKSTREKKSRHRVALKVAESELPN